MQTLVIFLEFYFIYLQVAFAKYQKITKPLTKIPTERSGGSEVKNRLAAEISGLVR